MRYIMIKRLIIWRNHKTTQFEYGKEVTYIDYFRLKQFYYKRIIPYEIVLIYI